MNKLEREMVELLKDLKQNYGVLKVKAEFEAEGARIDEVVRLRDIATRGGVGLVIKIGGAEAKSDMFHALQIGADCIIAPMVETAYSVKKYLDAVKDMVPKEDVEYLDIGINIETLTGSNNTEDILNKNDISHLKIVTVGRSDLSHSMHIEDVESKIVLEVCEKIMQSCKKKGLRCGMGGGLSPRSIEFIKYLVEKKLLDFYETRKVTFSNIHDSKENMLQGIQKAIKFEHLWLLNKKHHYMKICDEDNPRIERLKKHIESQ
ncbi:MAG: aldolase/citrate lyase family protein [Candidatus Micrarchaeota archaeon]